MKSLDEVKELFLWLRERGAIQVEVGDVRAVFAGPADVATHVDHADIIPDTSASPVELRRLSELEDHLMLRFGKDANEFLKGES